MDNKVRWHLSHEEKDKYIQALTEELPMLRAKANISQDDLARVIGISRQNYGSIERKDKKMSWNTYFSLIFFFDYNQSTHKMLRALSVFPYELLDFINESSGSQAFERVVEKSISMEGIESVLDEQALHAIRTLIMVEYARCSKIPGDTVVKSFDGKTFTKDITNQDIAIRKALNNMKRGAGKKL